MVKRQNEKTSGTIATKTDQCNFVTQMKHLKPTDPHFEEKTKAWDEYRAFARGDPNKMSTISRWMKDKKCTWTQSHKEVTTDASSKEGEIVNGLGTKFGPYFVFKQPYFTNIS